MIGCCIISTAVVTDECVLAKFSGMIFFPIFFANLCIMLGKDRSVFVLLLLLNRSQSAATIIKNTVTITVLEYRNMPQAVKNNKTNQSSEEDN